MAIHTNMNLEASSKRRTDAIIAKAQAEEDYREQLLANPKHAIQQAFGKELPLGLEVRVLEEAANVVYLVLPARQTGELSDADLEGVAGGFAPSADPRQRPINGCYSLDEWLTTVLM